MRRGVVGGIVTAVIAVGLVAGVAHALRIYREEAHARAVVSTYGATTDDRVDLYVTLLSVDPVQGQATARVVSFPRGSLSDDQGRPTRPLTLFANNLTGIQDRHYATGKTMDPFDMTVNLFDGQASDYPFDRFNAQLEFQLSDGDRPSEEGHGRHAAVLVPLQVTFSGNVHGCAVTPTHADTTVVGYIRLDLSTARSTTVVQTAVGGMIVMWAIAIAVLGLTLSILFWEHEAETFTFYSGLLFALFAFRNSLPGTPPVGTLSDYLAFFWAELIVATSLIVTIIFSLLPTRRKDEDLETP